MKFIRIIFFFSIFGLVGCTFHEEIYDKNLHDRVLACGAGFSDSIQADLAAAYHKSKLKADVSLAFKEETQAVIFSSIPSPDQLRAYEDYISCIEDKANVPTVKKKPSSFKKVLRIRRGTKNQPFNHSQNFF